MLFTSTMAWHVMQPEAGLRFGQVDRSRGSACRISPLNSSAGSWQPAHHFEDFTPLTSCMYSMALRYHWLLNDEKWCAELFHCL